MIKSAVNLLPTLALAIALPVLSQSLLNVKMPPFQALGNGKANDRRALQAALDSAARLGGGTVFMPPGMYRVEAAEEKGKRVFCLLIKSNVTLKGDGREATTIVLADSQINETRIITNHHCSPTSGDSNITFEDFSIDGNAGKQKAPASFGIRLVYAQKVLHNRILIKNIKGTPTVEGAFFDSYSSSHISYTDCEATQTIKGDTLTGSGFGITFCTGVEYIGCRASKSSSWQGFTSLHSRLVSYVNCHAYSNYERGFNSERSSEMQYINCISGGRTTMHGEGFPYTPNTSLGNRADGFYVWKSNNVLINNCVSVRNQWGIHNFESTNLRIIGGIINENDFGLGFEYAADARNTQVSGSPIISSNGKEMYIHGTDYQNTSGPMGPPPVPANGVDLLNPYPFEATVYIYGGTVQGISVMGQYMKGYSAGAVRLPAGGAIQIRYTKAPSWKWVLD
jgi:hypothetical protein